MVRLIVQELSGFFQTVTKASFTKYTELFVGRYYFKKSRECLAVIRKDFHAWGKGPIPVQADYNQHNFFNVMCFFNYSKIPLISGEGKYFEETLILESIFTYSK